MINGCKVEVVFNCDSTISECKFADRFTNGIGDLDCRHLESDSYIHECKNKEAILDAISNQ